MTRIDYFYLIWELGCLIITGIIYFAFKNSKSKNDKKKEVILCMEDSGLYIY